MISCRALECFSGVLPAAYACMALPQTPLPTVADAASQQALCMCSLEEGRLPWLDAQPMPQAELADHDAGVWALAVSPEGNTIAAGTEEGGVTLWDARSHDNLWQVLPQACLLMLLLGLPTDMACSVLS